MAEQVIETEDLAEEEQEIGIAHLKGTSKRIDVTLPAYDDAFDPKWNVRDPALYKQRVMRKVHELRADKAIRNALVITVDPEGVIRAACGFLRRQALCEIQRKYPEEFALYFSKVPVTVIENCTESDRELVMADHGSEESLNEYEVYLATVRLLKQNLKDKPICSVMAKMYLNLASASTKQKYMAKLEELAKEGFVMSGSTKIRTVTDIQLVTFRGRLQRYQRIHRAPASEIIVDIFRKGIMHEPGGLPITFKMAEALEKLTVEEAKEYLLDVQKAQKSSGPKKPSDRLWGAAKLTRARNNMKSISLQRVLDAALGKEDAQQEIPDIDDELLKIEAAMGHNPDKFWKCVDEILEDLDSTDLEDEDLESEDLESEDLESDIEDNE